MKEKVSIACLVIGIILIVVCRFLLDKSELNSFLFRLGGVLALVGIFATMYFRKNS